MSQRVLSFFVCILLCHYNTALHYTYTCMQVGRGDREWKEAKQKILDMESMLLDALEYNTRYSIYLCVL
jgi:hypothetical protein